MPLNGSNLPLGMMLKESSLVLN